MRASTKKNIQSRLNELTENAEMKGKKKNNKPVRSPLKKNKYKEDEEDKVYDQNRDKGRIQNKDQFVIKTLSDSSNSSSDKLEEEKKVPIQDSNSHNILGVQTRAQLKRISDENSKGISQSDEKRNKGKNQSKAQTQKEEKVKGKNQKQSKKPKKNTKRPKNPKLYNRGKIPDVEISDNEMDREERKQAVRGQRQSRGIYYDDEADNEPKFLLHELSNDIKYFKQAEIINRALKYQKETPAVQEALDLIFTIKFNNYETVEIDGKEYYVMSDNGLNILKNFKFMNIKSKYNIIHDIYAVRDKPNVIEFANTHRNFFCKWAYAAAHIDHEQFTTFLYQSICNYKAQRDETEDILNFKSKQIEPMTYAKMLYELGDCLLRDNTKIIKSMMKLERLQIQPEHVSQMIIQ